MIEGAKKMNRILLDRTTNRSGFAEALLVSVFVPPPNSLPEQDAQLNT
jgi:hypothetical protein